MTEFEQKLIKVLRDIEAELIKISEAIQDGTSR